MEITNEQHEKIHQLYTELWNLEWTDKPADLDGILPTLPEGDFEWRDEVGGDWHVYNCGDNDCPIQWHKVCYGTDIARRNGKLIIERHSCDEDGNWDYDFGWEEGEDWAEMGLILANDNFEYFKGWAEYYLECAQTGEDPLEEIINPAEIENMIDFLIDAAEEKIKYLKLSEKACI